MLEDYSVLVTSVSSSFFVLCTVVFLLRISHRRVRQCYFIIDDGLIIFAFCVLVAQYAIITKLISLGMGKRESADAAPHETVLILRYALNIVGQTITAVAKLSIAINCLAFSKLYNGRYYQLFARGVVLFQIVFMGSIIPFLVPCYPLSRFWRGITGDASIAKVPGCVNIVTLYTVMMAIGFLNDIFLLAAPVPIIRRLPKRLAIQCATFLLGLGLVVIILDIARLAIQHGLLVDIRTDAATTFNSTMATFICTWLKQYIIFIVACMPKARVTLMDMLHRQAETESLADSTEQSVLRITCETLTGERGSHAGFRPGQGASKLTDEKETIIEYSHTDCSSTTMELPWNHFQGDLEGGLASDRHNWLDVTKANAYKVRHSSTANTVSPISPFHLRMGEWEELYPADEVQIKPFDSQFAIETTNVLPFGSGTPLKQEAQSEVVLCQADVPPEDRITGRSALQKAYYDQVQAMRAQNAVLQDSQAKRAKDDLDVRKGSTTIPKGLFDP